MEAEIAKNDEPGVDQQYKIDKKTLNHIRTTSRNNIERIKIADQKASVLMSLNAIMITILIPAIIANLDKVLEELYYVPLILIAITCTITLYLSAKALQPISLDYTKTIYGNSNVPSPFFFGNFFKMKPDEFRSYYQSTVSSREGLAEFVLQDIFHIGRIVSRKYQIIRRAYMIFLNGLFIVIVVCVVLVLSK
jgi:hypothetical protein